MTIYSLDILLSLSGTSIFLINLFTPIHQINFVELVNMLDAESERKEDGVGKLKFSLIFFFM